MRLGHAFRAAAGLSILALAGCFTEIGNPGKEQAVTAQFRIDYSAGPAPLPKAAAGSALAAIARDSVYAFDSLRILQFYMSVVEVNYDDSNEVQGRIWRVPDSLGRSVDFTGKDKTAVLPPVAVPPTTYTILKLECRIPNHAVLPKETVDFDRFSDRGYIKGIRYRGGKRIRFLWQLPDAYKINLVYTQDILEQWRHGDSYAFDFVFFATRWLAAVNLDTATANPGADGEPVAVIDLEHNPLLYQALKAQFKKSFNSSEVWKENPSP